MIRMALLWLELLGPCSGKIDLVMESLTLTFAVEDQISRAELRLTDIADTLQGDWEVLAQQLGITDDEISKIRTEYTYVSEQALVMLHLWVQKNQDRATGILIVPL